MASRDKRKRYDQMMNTIEESAPSNWEDIGRILSMIEDSASGRSSISWHEYNRRMAKGVAFITFDYGIDGVSIEISKYAQALEDRLKGEGETEIHFIGGDFYPQADSVIKPAWHRFRIPGINGWSKWGKGKWFSGLFYEDMPAGSEAASRLAVEIFQQAVSISRRLGSYLAENDISLLIPVNIHSNPGNMALALAVALVSEGMGMYVINSNHDFYWEGGKPADERKPGEPPGVRDHFFRNASNNPFFTLLKRLYPWNGRYWLQVNINRLQSEKLAGKFGFSEEKVFELSTSVSDKFFEDYSDKDVQSARLRMSYILSDGQPIMHPVPVYTHLAILGEWMGNQKPCILSAREGLALDPTSGNLIYLLQPTRVVARKRIERDIHLLIALIGHPPFREIFENDEKLQILLQITGPTPIEHQSDLEKLLQAYIRMIESLPDQIADRLFLAFSVGNEEHPSYTANGFKRLTIEDIYRMATAVVFPSETEGRGLPIIEASASRIPLICSRYYPEEVFAGVVGEGLEDNKQILYTLFPEGDFNESFLDEVTELLLHPEKSQLRLEHNREAVRLRYSTRSLRETFENLLRTLWRTTA